MSKFIEYRHKYVAKLIDRYGFNGMKVADLGAGGCELWDYVNWDCEVDAFDIDYSDVETSDYVRNNLSGILINKKKKDITKIKSLKKYDMIICSEVLEHLYSEESNHIVDKLEGYKGIVIVSIPNAFRLTNRIRRFFGLKPKFMDKTHRREYDIETIEWCPDKIKDFPKFIDYIILYLPFEKVIGWLVPWRVREWILKRRPLWSSHGVYVYGNKI